MQCETCFCPLRVHNARCFQCVNNPLPPNAIDMAEQVDVCLGCEETLCPFHTPERALRRGLCVRCYAGRNFWFSDESDESESDARQDSEDNRYVSEDEDEVHYQPEWWSDDEVIVPTANKRAKRCDPEDMVALLQPLQTETDQVCSICLDGLQNAVALPCSTKHGFHKNCITTWLGTQRNTCPVCNTTFA